MGLFAYIKNGVKYKMNQFPGAYPASRVSYSGSNVETALDELNADITAHTLGTSVDISAYTGSDYTCPSDGYIKVYASGTVGNKVQVSIGGVSDMLYARCVLSGYGDADSILVRKGTTVRIASIAGGTAEFIPLN